ncbi:MAG: methylglyoxal synthase [Bacteroidota bacterium]
MKNIAVIAHDVKKPELAEFVELHRAWILGVHIVATGRTAEYLESKNIEVKHLSQGRYGGYKQISEMILLKEIDLVLFFVDPDVKQPHHKDIEQLIDFCNHHNIPLATNYASAELLIIGMIKKEEAEKAKKRLQ